MREPTGHPVALPTTTTTRVDSFGAQTTDGFGPVRGPGQPRVQQCRNQSTEQQQCRSPCNLCRQHTAAGDLCRQYTAAGVGCSRKSPGEPLRLMPASPPARRAILHGGRPLGQRDDSVSGPTAAAATPSVRLPALRRRDAGGVLGTVATEPAGSGRPSRICWSKSLVVESLKT